MAPAKNTSATPSLLTQRTSSIHDEQTSRTLETRQIPVACDDCPKDCQHPLTVFAKHHIRPGCETIFEEWVKEISEYQEKNVKGYLGSEMIRPMIRPMTCESDEYVSIFRYDSYQHLHAWMDSEYRIDMLRKTDTFSETPVLIAYHSLEYWFIPKDQSEGKKGRTPPPKYKMCVLTFLVIWSEIQWIPQLVARIPGISLLGVEAVGTFFLVALATYIFMPICTRLLAFWLFPESNYLQVLTELWPSMLPKPWEKKAPRTDDETTQRDDPV